MALQTSISHLTLGLSISLVLAACSGAQPRQAGDDSGWEKPAKTSTDDGEGASSSADSTADEGTKWADATEPAKLNEDQIAQMEIALKRGSTKATSCATVVENAPTGEGPVSVTFDGKIGKITEVEVGAPFAGTPAESCIKRAFIGEYCLPFDGDPKVVRYKVKLPAKDAAAAPKK